jgi:hypothetical protein
LKGIKDERTREMDAIAQELRAKKWGRGRKRAKEREKRNFE